jgi:hypothetical protein
MALFHRLPKDVRAKYAPPVPPDEEVAVFAMKAALAFVLLFLGAVGLDVYSLLQ